MQGQPLESNFAQFKSNWLRYSVAILILLALGISVWSYRIPTAHGFLTDDCNHLVESYKYGLQFFPQQYLPWAAAHRQLGRDAITLLLRVFGENDIPIIWTLLSIHLASASLLWLAFYRLTASWWSSLAGAAFFLLNIAAYLPIYWPAAIFDTLSTFFLCCLLLSVSVILQPTRNYRPWLLLLTLPLLLAAVKSKESAIVAIVPLFLMLIFAGSLRSDSRPSTFGSFLRDLVGRLRKVPAWEAAWAILSVLLMVTLALSVDSDYREANNPDYPYYAEYSFEVIGRSFGYYIVTLLFRSSDLNPMHPAIALSLLLAPLVLACWLKNRLMILGWVWYVVFLLPLAALKNHYNNYYYPYPANIGVGLFITGFVSALEIFWNQRKGTRYLRYVFPLILVALMWQQAYHWIKSDSVPNWYDAHHARSRQMIQALKAVLPDPPNNAEIVLVVPEVTQFDHSPSQVLRVAYHNLTLSGMLFRDQQQAEAYWASRIPGTSVLAVWKGDRFELIR